MLVDLYKNGYAPKDSVNWGFNEIVAGFYSGTCALLDQDPDALIAIAERMKPEDFGVAAMPQGPGRQGLPDHRLCRLVDVRGQREQGPRLEADRDAGRRRKATSPGTSVTGALPALTSAPRTIPSTPSTQFKGWFEELADPNAGPDGRCRPTSRSSPSSRTPSSIKTGQEALLGDITPEELADEWADYLTEAQQKFLAK